jgi:hypothetical protein
MTGLAAGSATALGAQRLGRWFGQAIGRGRLAAVGAVEGQPSSKFFELATEFMHLGFQAQQPINELAQTGACQLEELLPSAHALKTCRKCSVKG